MTGRSTRDPAGFSTDRPKAGENSVQKVTNYFHLHLVSDSTGETLITVARAAAAQYDSIEAIEHVHPLVRNDRQLDRALIEIEASPGIVLYTLVNAELAQRLERFCRDQGAPCVSVLSPVHDVFRTYLNVAQTYKAGAQHELDASYFRRIDALNFTLVHDDGQLAEDADDADVVVIGVSRTSKTPTSIYLANRGVKVANIPFVPGVPIPESVFAATRPLIVGLVASPERIAQIRENRVLSLGSRAFDTSYVDRQAIAQEIAQMRRLCADNGWPLIDVTRRSIEETAAGIIALQRDRKGPLA
ncbi:kinase/pyrophosphorylase [Hyphomicrobiaceae bacterium 22]|uniref:Putative pyruvate, phosphate dikinase regulatory protein n=1 Tax=Prosthecodimorpha staleyi TaxID=2840188 RepID=A0A947GC04_9HYPH|nr:kinase/pyrophosphorylase [Prosthecodimorpha staleyi]